MAPGVLQHPVEAAGIEPAPGGAKLPAESRPYLASARNAWESISRRVPSCPTPFQPIPHAPATYVQHGGGCPPPVSRLGPAPCPSMGCALRWCSPWPELRLLHPGPLPCPGARSWLSGRAAILRKSSPGPIRYYPQRRTRLFVSERASHFCSMSQPALRQRPARKSQRPGTRGSPTSSERRHCPGRMGGGVPFRRLPSPGPCWRSGAFMSSTMTGFGFGTSRADAPSPPQVRRWASDSVSWRGRRSSWER